MVGWHHRLNVHEFEKTSGDSERQGKPGVLQSMGSQGVGQDLATEQKKCSLSVCRKWQFLYQTPSGT